MNFFDTCALLDLKQDVFDSNFLISNITLSELEEIKTSKNKDEQIKASAREVLRLLANNEKKYDIAIYHNSLDEKLKEQGLLINNDSRIVMTALACAETRHDITFYTSDLSCKGIAKVLGLDVKLTQEEIKEDNYTGYKEIVMSDEEIDLFYREILNKHDNHFQLKDNEYLLILNKENEVIDKYKWNKTEGYQKVNYIKINTKAFGKIAPKNQDPYQQLALDSIFSNQVTVLRGRAGTGKSWLSLGCLMAMLEKGTIDKIIIFCNTVAVRGAAKLGSTIGVRLK